MSLNTSLLLDAIERKLREKELENIQEAENSSIKEEDPVANERGVVANENVVVANDNEQADSGVGSPQHDSKFPILNAVRQAKKTEVVSELDSQTTNLQKLNETNEPPVRIKPIVKGE